MAHSFNPHRGAAIAARAEAAVGGVFARLTAWNEARRTRAALSRLSAHELDDIGLLRADIDRIAERRY